MTGFQTMRASGVVCFQTCSNILLFNDGRWFCGQVFINNITFCSVIHSVKSGIEIHCQGSLLSMEVWAIAVFKLSYSCLTLPIKKYFLALFYHQFFTHRFSSSTQEVHLTWEKGSLSFIKTVLTPETYYEGIFSQSQCLAGQRLNVPCPACKCQSCSHSSGLGPGLDSPDIAGGKTSIYVSHMS